MKKSLAFVFAAVLALGGTALAKEATSTFHVKGWHCSDCSRKTVKAVEHVKGVKIAEADRKAGTLTVTYDDAAVHPAQLEKAVSSAGFHCAK